LAASQAATTSAWRCVAVRAACIARLSDFAFSRMIAR